MQNQCLKGILFYLKMSPQHQMFGHMHMTQTDVNGKKNLTKIRHLAVLDGCAALFQDKMSRVMRKPAFYIC